jgi:hypothetical protein
MVTLIRKGCRRAALAALICCMGGGCVVGAVDLDVGEGPKDQEATASIDRVIPVTTQAGIRFSGINGSVGIRGVPEAEAVSIHATKRVRSHSMDDAVAHLQDVQIRVHAGYEEIRVETEQPGHADRRTYVVDYEIEVPNRFRVAGVNANGDAEVRYQRGPVGLQVGNGNVTLVDLEGSVWVVSGNGNLHASVFLGPDEEFVVSMGNGSADRSVQEEVSAELTAWVGNGTIAVSGLSVSNPVSGANFFRGTLGSGEGLIDLTVGNGLIRVKGM